MKFNCFPKKQHSFLVYSSFLVFRSRFFNNLILQSSPKNSLFFRFLKSDIGFWLSSIRKLHIDVPKNNVEFAGIIKGRTIILFEMRGEKPSWVWRKNNYADWAKEKFIGYQLLSEYTENEFDLKYETIQEALKLHWNSFDNDSSLVHGDLTHFNILIDDEKNIFFIDNKRHENSKLFDFYYFYAYLIQSISRCSTLDKKSKSRIKINIKLILKKVCLYKSENDFYKDYNSIKIPEFCGIQNQNKQMYLNEFLQIFIK